MKPNHDTQNLSSKVDFIKFEKFLRGYSESDKQFIVSGFARDFTLNFHGEHNCVVETENLPSAREQPSLLWEKIRKEVEEGRVVGPFEKPPFKKYYCSPLGLVPKAGQEGKYRMIFHLSAGKPVSMNEQTPKEFCSVPYNNFDKAVELIQKTGREAKIGKADLKAAFRQVPIRPEDWHLLVFKAPDEQGKTWYFFDKSLPFGSLASCQIYQRISNGLAWAVTNLTKRPVVNYLDDFLFVDQNNFNCDKQIVTFQWICEEIKIPVSLDKMEWSEEMKVFLGLLLHGRLQLISIPEEKLQKCNNLVDKYLKKKRAKVQKLMKLAGTLNFLCRALNFGRTFLRSIYSQIQTMQNHLDWHVKVSEEIKLDL